MTLPCSEKIATHGCDRLREAHEEVVVEPRRRAGCRRRSPAMRGVRGRDEVVAPQHRRDRSAEPHGDAGDVEVIAAQHAAAGPLLDLDGGLDGAVERRVVDLEPVTLQTHADVDRSVGTSLDAEAAKSARSALRRHRHPRRGGSAPRRAPRRPARARRARRRPADSDARRTRPVRRARRRRLPRARAPPRCSGTPPSARQRPGGGRRMASPGSRAPAPPRRRAARRRRARVRGCRGDVRTAPWLLEQARRRARPPVPAPAAVRRWHAGSGSAARAGTVPRRRRTCAGSGGGGNTIGVAGVWCANSRPSARITVMLSLPPASFAAAIRACDCRCRDRPRAAARDG